MSGRLRDRVEDEANNLLRERVARLRQAFEEALTPLSAAIDLPLAPGEWGAAGGSEHLRMLRDALEAFAQGGTQRDVLSALLDAAATCYRRTALFVLRDGSLAGWSGLGFTGGGTFGNEELPGVSLPASGDHLLAQALQRRTLAMAGQDGPGEVIVTRLGRLRPRESVAMPLLVRGRPVAVLYGDTGSEDEPGQSLSFEIMARMAGLTLTAQVASQGRRTRSAGTSPTGALQARDTLAPAGEAGPGAPTPPEEAEIQALLGDLDGHPRRESADSGMSDEDRRTHAGWGVMLDGVEDPFRIRANDLTPTDLGHRRHPDDLDERDDRLPEDVCLSPYPAGVGKHLLAPRDVRDRLRVPDGGKQFHVGSSPQLVQQAKALQPGLRTQVDREHDALGRANEGVHDLAESDRVFRVFRSVHGRVQVIPGALHNATPLLDVQ